MSSQWHYSKDGSQHGPVTSQRLRELAASGELEPNDLIWKEGLADWRPAISLKGLFPEHAKPFGPPPLPTTATPTSPSTPPPTAGGPATTTGRKPDFFDKARELAQRATETVAQAKAKAEVYQKEVQEKYAKTVVKAQERLDRPVPPAAKANTNSPAMRPENPQPTEPGAPTTTPDGSSDRAEGHTQIGADQDKAGPGPSDIAQGSSRDSILDSLFGWILLAFRRWKKFLEPTDPESIQNVALDKLFWQKDRDKYLGMLGEVDAYAGVCNTQPGVSHAARRFFANEMDYWFSLTDDEQTVGEVLELHRRAKLAYEGVEPLPDPRPVDHFKLELMRNERKRKAEAAREAAKFENMREAVYRGNQDHAVMERIAARSRRFLKGK